MGLIEAYWNVNRRLSIESKTIRSGLIEAYWNVNRKNGKSTLAAALGLIEAYWNVNITIDDAHPTLKRRFNRSILKCKCVFYAWKEQNKWKV